jgi:hypothetical protein
MRELGLYGRRPRVSAKIVPLWMLNLTQREVPCIIEANIPYSCQKQIPITFQGKTGMQFSKKSRAIFNSHNPDIFIGERRPKTA